MHLNIKEENELYLEFNKIRHINETESHIYNSVFYGPVLNNLVDISDCDSLIMSFSKQHIIIGPSLDYYTLVLYWDGIEFIEDGKIIKLKNSILKYKRIGLLKDLNETNTILLNCEKHKEEIHYKYPMYEAWILDKDGYLL